MPERIRIDGDSSAPAHSTTSFAEIPSIDPSGTLDLHAGAPTPVDDQPANERVRANRQIRPRARRRQVTDGARHAQPTEFVHRLRSRAERPRIVAVGAVGVTERARRFQKCAVLRQQFLRRIPAYRNRPCVAVIRRIAEIEIAFEPLERRQHAVPGPRAIAETRPLVVVLGYAAQRDGRVHRARSTDHPAARERHAAPARRFVRQPPIVIAVRVVVAVDEVERRARDVGIVRAGFDQRHAAIRIFRRAGGNRATGTAGADDQNVIHLSCGRVCGLCRETELTHVHRTRSSRCR